jgi:UDP-glucose 4-epimerase
MARCLVTGGAGFIGSHLVEKLVNAGHSVSVLDDLSSGLQAQVHPQADLIVGDVTDAPLVRRVISGCDCVFHLAALASVELSKLDWLRSHRVNQTGTVIVLDAARSTGSIPVVYASSAAVYGDGATLPLSEDAYPRPLTAYGADKLGSELHAMTGWVIHGVPSVGLRFFNVFGPRQNPASPYSGVISRFVDGVTRGSQLVIYGDGQQTRDFVFVDDVIRHVIAAMRLVIASPRAYICNVCSGRSVTIAELALSVGEALGREVTAIHELPRSGEIRHSVGDAATATRLLGITAETGLSDGLRNTLRAAGRRTP